MTTAKECGLLDKLDRSPQKSNIYLYLQSVTQLAGTESKQKRFSKLFVRATACQFSQHERQPDFPFLRMHVTHERYKEGKGRRERQKEITGASLLQEANKKVVIRSDSRFISSAESKHLAPAPRRHREYYYQTISEKCFLHWRAGS